MARTMDTPVAIASAVSIASAPRATPATRSPAIISLTEFVTATPGKRGIKEPMIIKSRCSPNDSEKNRMEERAAMIVAMNSATNLVSLTIEFSDMSVTFARRPAIKAGAKSLIVPPNTIARQPLATPAATC